MNFAWALTTNGTISLNSPAIHLGVTSTCVDTSLTSRTVPTSHVGHLVTVSTAIFRYQIPSYRWFALTDRLQSSHVNQTRALAPPTVVRYVQQIFADSGDVVPENIEHVVELFDRDINRLDGDRYATPMVFVLPEAIHTGNRSSITDHINGAILAGHPLTLSLRSLATRVFSTNSSLIGRKLWEWST
jgi:hypothetical protein